MIIYHSFATEVLEVDFAADLVADLAEDLVADCLVGVFEADFLTDSVF